ncbi:MAG: hypothetical protein ACREUO_02170 [Burkholderiales bacterium]
MTRSRSSYHRWMRTAAGLALIAGLSACEPFAIMSFGVGASTAVSHTLGGITYRTFTAPAARVKSASLGALNRMGIKLAGTEKGPDGEILRAKAAGRDIEITLEPISPNTTRMKVIARNGTFFYDSSTATEIILQTERLLGNAGTKGETA